MSLFSPAARIPWTNVVLAALLMVATLPGRTQGLGLITEPMLAELKLDRVVYASINLWATLIGSLACLPTGWLLDRIGLRKVTVVILLVLSVVVGRMSSHAGSTMLLFVWVLLTRAFGQSALSVASITAVGKGTDKRAGLAMGVFSVLLSVFFIIAFVVVGGQITDSGWRHAWWQISVALVVVVVVVMLFLREPERVVGDSQEVLTGTSLVHALRTPAFWIFGGATALFGLVSSGLGLFNEAVLAEAGFDQETFHTFLAVTTLFALVGQALCGWLTLKRRMPALLAIAMFLYAAGLGTLPMLRSQTQLWLIAALMGVAAGFITVIFFAVWGHAYGRIELGRIQGAAQMLTVFASAIGPLLFAECHARTGSYAPLLYSLSPVVLVVGVVAWRITLPEPALASQPDRQL